MKKLIRLIVVLAVAYLAVKYCTDHYGNMIQLPGGLGGTQTETTEETDGGWFSFMRNNDLLEKLGMCSRANQLDGLGFFIQPYQEEVVLDVAFHTSGKLSRKHMRLVRAVNRPMLLQLNQNILKCL